MLEKVKEDKNKHQLKQINTANILVGRAFTIRHALNPLSLKSDEQHISPCDIQYFVQQSGHANYCRDLRYMFVT